MVELIVQVTITVFLTGILPLTILTIIVRYFRPGRFLVIPTIILMTAISKNIFKWLAYSKSVETVSYIILGVLLFLAVFLFGDQILGKKDEDEEKIEEEIKD